MCGHFSILFHFSSFFFFYFTALSQNQETLGPGGVFHIPKLKPLNEAKHCIECQAVFNIFRQKYFCRNCGKVCFLERKGLLISLTKVVSSVAIAQVIGIHSRSLVITSKWGRGFV